MNPAIPLLLRCHCASRIRRMRATLTSSRRTILMLAAVALGMIWLGQTIASVIFREPYNPASFRSWTTLILGSYFFWHFIRVAYKRPDQAIEWSPAEAAQIVGGPFLRRDVLLYRFLIILTSIIPKALLAAFVLLPDLWWSGLPGIVLALVFLESFRMAIDIAASCLTSRSYLVARCLVFGALLMVVGALAISAAQATDPSTTPWAQRMVAAFDQLRGSTSGQLVERPFAALADVIAAQQFSTTLVLNIVLATAMVWGVLLAIGWLDHRHEDLLVRRQQAMTSAGCLGEESPFRESQQLPVVPQLALVGPIIWRQCKSALRYKGSLFVALAIPAVLSCLPLFSVPDTTYAFLALVGTVVFYSFVLLPEAIKFDFRLDCDHLEQLKVLPVPAYRLVAGQLAVPIFVATLFQTGLYLLSGVVRPIPPLLVVSAILLSLPINILFVAIDNLIFLLYPHRPTQEGFEAFFRTILKFTFKSVLLGVASGFVLFWSLSSRFLVDAAGQPELVRLTFVAGLWLAACLSALLAFAAVTWAFEKYDVSNGVPA